MPLDDGTRRALAAAARSLEAAGLRARLELPEKLHVTLAFLGSVDGERVDDLCAAVRGGLKGIPAFDVRFDTLGGFPNERRARIAWAGSRSKDARFARLADGVRESCRAFATLDEKPPVLHVTLGRLRDPMPLPAIRFDARTMRVDTVALFESLPGEKTTRYEIVDRFALTVQASSPAASR